MPRLLTVWFVCLTDKFFTNPKLSLINVPALNYLLRSKIFVNDDGQLRAVHLILDFESISRSFLDVGNSIRAGDHRLTRIDVSRPNFLAPYDLPPIEHPIPSHRGYPLLPNRYKKYPLGRPSSEKAQLPLPPSNKRLTDSDLKKKQSLYRRPKKRRMSIRVCKLLLR